MRYKVNWAILEDIQKYAPKLFPNDTLEESGKETSKDVINKLREYYNNNMPIDVTPWTRVNVPDSNMYYKQQFTEQISFVVDVLSKIFFPSLKEYEKSPVVVIGTHISKSIVLPVYQIKVDDIAIVLTLRNNFYNWKVSVNSSIPIEFDTMELFDPSETISPSLCEGFPDELVYDCYNKNHSQFTCEIRTQYDLYTFFYLLNNYLKKK